MDKLCLNNPDKLALGNPARLSRIKIIWAKDFFSFSLGSFNTENFNFTKNYLKNQVRNDFTSFTITNLPAGFDTGTGNGLAKKSSSLSLWFSFPSSSSKLSSFLT